MRILSRIQVAVGILMVGFLTACSPAAPLNLLARGGSWTINSDKFGDNLRNGVDIYMPEAVRNAPVIVFFYGGNWQSGHKETYRFVAASLAAVSYTHLDVYKRQYYLCKRWIRGTLRKAPLIRAGILR